MKAFGGVKARSEPRRARPGHGSDPLVIVGPKRRTSASIAGGRARAHRQRSDTHSGASPTQTRLESCAMLDNDRCDASSRRQMNVEQNLRAVPAGCSMVEVTPS